MKHKTEKEINRDCLEFVQLLMKAVDVIGVLDEPNRLQFSADWGEPTLTLEFPIPDMKKVKMSHTHFGIPRHDDYLANFDGVVRQLNEFLREYIKEWESIND